MKESDKIELYDFFFKKSDKLEDFHSWWKSMNLKYPENFPLFLKECDWEEQFNFYCEERNN